ncbi:hypothetical protein Barb4_01815 [Bacteroidales bacterium Barb4]|nr:hypothetical protein Barb4_01815 [Bacteroidales bacterium Barb4]
MKLAQHPFPFSFLLPALFLFTACEKGKLEEEAPAENEWIYNTMEQHYLWYDDIPDRKQLDFKLSPQQFFASLLSEKDGNEDAHGRRHVFSYIERKPLATKALSETSPVYGFEYAVFSVEHSGTYYAEVLYVLPDSPAEEAGLKRGDWITGIGENRISLTDYISLGTGNGVTYQLSRYDPQRGLVNNGSVDIPPARLVRDYPILKDTVLHIGGKAVGYLMYNTFTSGPGNRDETYDEQLKEAFRRFKTAQVTDFVLDMRYNGGGLLNSARLLASMLAPSDVFGKVFTRMVFNDKNRWQDHTTSFFNAVAMSSYNLNLSRLYVLTGTSTASSSEAVINGLIPYIGRENMTLIGERTIGKTVGSNTFGEDNDYGWLLHPITLRISNADEQSDYTKGFAPDIEMEELIPGQILYPFGDPQELLLSCALQEITGQTALRSAESAPAPSLLPPLRLVGLSIENK